MATTAPRYTPKAQTVHGAPTTWHLHDAVTDELAHTLDGTRLLVFPTKARARHIAERANRHQEFLAAIEPGDTIEAICPGRVNGHPIARLVRLTLDRTPWSIGTPGADTAVVTDGRGAAVVRLSSIKILARTRLLAAA